MLSHLVRLSISKQLPCEIVRFNPKRLMSTNTTNNTNNTNIDNVVALQQENEKLNNIIKQYEQIEQIERIHKSYRVAGDIIGISGMLAGITILLLCPLAWKIKQDL